MFRRASPLLLLGATRPAHDFIKSQDPSHEDARWLEANTEEMKLRTPEERYAHEKERVLLEKMMAQMRVETKAHVQQLHQEHGEKHAAEVSQLKQQLAAMTEKLDSLLKQ